jgi:hypothetical protein
MKHVFLETNWVVEYAAPAHLRAPTALATRAKAGELQIHVPSVCLTEARHPIRTRFQPRPAADSIRKYLAWAATEGMLNAEDSRTVRRELDRFETAVEAELEGVEDRLRLLCDHPGVEVFPLDEEMLARVVGLSTEKMDLKPFDQAILAAVLVRAQRLRDSGAEDVCFCELDWDLRPWDKNGGTKQPLTALYDSAGVWVYSDFTMENPARRPGFAEK